MPIIRQVGKLKTRTGNPYRLGAILEDGGVNFALFSKHATQVSLLFFEENGKPPVHRISLDPKENKTGDVWHIFVYGIREGQRYGYIVDGSWEPSQGHRFNPNKLLIDPYSKSITGGFHWDRKTAYAYVKDSVEGDLSFSKEKSFDSEVRGQVISTTNFDWERDKPLQISMADTIIYEMHVRGFTIDRSSGAQHPGSYLGIIEKIPYLNDLGITTVELLPVQAFNELENFKTDPLTGRKLRNYWGYSTLGFFAPESWYASKHHGNESVTEFKEMVKALHQSKIEVILDVVYNHSGEGNEYGPHISFKGFDNSIYYMLEDGRHYKNYSGCGNTLNCNHPVVKNMILDSLRYWVVDMHVDGFRFDLAAILGRDKDGNWMPNYSLLSEISHDPILSSAKIIAEGWDAAGLYKVGGFPEGWSEWNGKFRDDMRAFVKGDEGKAGEIAKRISGSPDLFLERGNPYHSINFITSHDGFTLHDLVSYNQKHNENNAENNADGDNNNLSWNCGVEGSTKDVKILKLRDRQMKNLFALLMVSQGTPMILSGDEVCFSKKGNNNTYCQDNEFSWFDWDLVEKNKEFLGYCRYLIDFRKKNSCLRRRRFFEGQSEDKPFPDISWHGVRVNQPDWQHHSHTLAFMIHQDDHGRCEKDCPIYVALNSYWEALDFEIPPLGSEREWKIHINTAIQPGYFPKGRKLENVSRIRIEPRSLIILSGHLI